jgi:hypothetical protein
MKDTQKYGGPHQVTKHAWYYVERDGIHYVQEEYDGDRYVKTHMVKVPWKVIKTVAAGAP